MNNNEGSYNIAAVLELVKAAFDDDGLSEFCFAHFKPVYDQFTAGQNRGTRLRLLVEYAQRNGQLGRLLDHIKTANPYQYKQFASRLGMSGTSLPPSGSQKGTPAPGETIPSSTTEQTWDVFISHASEDKDFVRRLAEALNQRGKRVWYDEFTLKVGDSLRRSIDQGLAHSQYGIVVLSPHFFAKAWPQRELDGLVARESDGHKVILPIWHNISAAEVRQYSPTLADRLAISTTHSLDEVVTKLLDAME